MDRETLYKQWQDPTGDTALGLNRIKTHKGPSQAEIEVGIKRLKELRVLIRSTMFNIEIL